MKTNKKHKFLKYANLDIFVGSTLYLVGEVLAILKCKKINKPKFFTFMNPHSYVEAMENKSFYNSLKCSDYIMVDGIGFMYALKLLYRQEINRNTGMTVFRSILENIPKCMPLNVFFIGSTQDTLNKITLKFKSEFPNLNLVGTYSPPFKSEWTEKEISHMQSLISRNKIDILFVGLTAPKQEMLISEHLLTTDCKVILAIGAVFDYYAGTKIYPKKYIRYLGLEWLHRLLLEPKRMWRRTFISIPKFMLWMIIEKVKFHGG